MKAADIIKIREELKTSRTPMEGHWDELHRLFMPFRMDSNGIPDIISADDLHDSTGRSAALILANGLASLVTPREEVWFEYAPPTEFAKNSEIIKWYRDCSDVARFYLEASNFYEEIQECYIDSPVFGTSALYCGDLDDDDGLIHFKQLPISTYYIDEDAKGKVNLVIRDLYYTAEQAAEEYGAENLPREIRDKIGKSTGKTEKYTFFHYVGKRAPSVRPKFKDDDEELAWEAEQEARPDSEKSPFVSYVVSETGKKTVAEGGFWEFPFAVHRYRKFGKCIWGFGPGFIAKGDVRQASLLGDLHDVGVEKAMFPPVKAPASLEGEVAQGPLEVTYFDDSDPNRGSGIDVWGAPAHQAIAAAREGIGDKRATIREAFHVDLFKMFTSRAMEGDPLTATEATLIDQEKLTQFSPVFGRLVTENLNVVMQRLFAVLWRAGKFPDVPLSLARPGAGVPAPAVQYKNRVVLAMQARRNGALMDFFSFAAPIVQAAPQSIQRLKTDVMLRDSARNAGLPEDWIYSDKEFAKIQAAQAEQQRMMQEAELAAQAGQAAANISKIPASEREAAALRQGGTGTIPR